MSMPNRTVPRRVKRVGRAWPDTRAPETTPQPDPYAAPTQLGMLAMIGLIIVLLIMLPASSWAHDRTANDNHWSLK